MTANIIPIGSEYVTDATGGLRAAPNPNTPKKINPIQTIWPPDSDSPSHCVLSQAEMIVDALRTKGVPVAYLPFAGEQHGFRQAKNIKRALEAELYFYSKVFRFPLGETIEPVTIENL